LNARQGRSRRRDFASAYFASSYFASAYFASSFARASAFSHMRM